MAQAARLVLRRALTVSAVLACCGCLACATAPESPAGRGERVHVVRPGETLWRIARAHGTTVEALMRANGIEDPRKLRAGTRLRIPPPGRAPPARAGARDGVERPRGRRGPPREADGNRFVWPVRGPVSSGFGMRDGAYHDGIDIRAPEGTPVVAAEAGRVVHADDRLRGYGNLVIVKHRGRYSTVYAHNRRNLVREGEFVERGQTIAEVGASGRATAPHLHFEIRRDGRPVDPLDYLP